MKQEYPHPPIPEEPPYDPAGEILDRWFGGPTGKPEPPGGRKPSLKPLLWVAVATVLLVLAFFGIHFWNPATCTQPENCRLCGKTRGDVVPHSWQDATCTAPRRCALCRTSQGEELGHRWAASTHNDKICRRCNITRPLEQVQVAQLLAFPGRIMTIWSDGTPRAISSYPVNQDGELHASLVLTEWSNIVALSAQSNFTVGLKDNGTVIAAGNNFYGQCATRRWANIVDIATSRNHTVALQKGGHVLTTGNDRNNNYDVVLWRDIVQIGAGSHFTVGLTSGGWVNVAGLLTGKNHPKYWQDIVDICTTEETITGLKGDGTVVSYGHTDKVQTQAGYWKNVTHIYATDTTIAAIRSNGTVALAGPDPIWAGYQQEIARWQNVESLYLGDTYLVGILTDGTVVSAGVPEDMAGELARWQDILAVVPGQDCLVGLTAQGQLLLTGQELDLTNLLP